MIGNGKVFISHSHADNERCKPLLAALDSWGVDYWFDTERMRAGDTLTRRIEEAITERDIFIRVCTENVQASHWMDLEAGAFHALLAEDQQQGRRGKRVLINLVLDQDYRLRPFERATIFIDAAHLTQSVWLNELRQALNLVPNPAPRSPAPASVEAPSAAAKPKAARAPAKRAVAPSPHQTPRTLWASVFGYRRRLTGNTIKDAEDFGVELTKGMSRLAAASLGFIGVTVLLVVTLITAFTHTIFGSSVPASHTGIGFNAFGVGIIGVIMTLAKPVWGAVLLLVVGLGFIYVVGWGAILATPFLLFAAGLAFVGRPKSAK